MNYLNKNLTNKTKYIYIYILYNLITFIKGLKLNQNHLNIYIDFKNLLYILTFLKFNTISNLLCLMDIIAIDNINNNEYRFKLIYSFWNITYEYKINIYFFINNFNSIYSLNKLYKSSIWLEREVWDMYGINFYSIQD